MAAKILAKGGDISTMPVEYAPNVTKKYNAANCEALGIAPPDGYEALLIEQQLFNHHHNSEEGR